MRNVISSTLNPNLVYHPGTVLRRGNRELLTPGSDGAIQKNAFIRATRNIWGWYVKAQGPGPYNILIYRGTPYTFQTGGGEIIFLRFSRVLKNAKKIQLHLWLFFFN